MAYGLNGTNQRITTGNIYGNSPTAISMSIWVRRNGAQATRTIWAHSASNNLFFRFFLDASTQPNFTYRDSGFTTQANITRTGALADLTWTHFCVSVTTNSATFYVDGISAGTDTSVSMANNNPTKSSFGASDANGSGSWQNHFAGELAEAGVWLGTLTADEVVALAKGMTCDKIRPQSLVFYAPLVRALVDQKGGLALTNNNGATVANHPRVYA